MLPGYDPTKNEVGFMKVWQTKMQRRRNGQK